MKIDYQYRRTSFYRWTSKEYQIVKLKRDKIKSLMVNKDDGKGYKKNGGTGKGFTENKVYLGSN